MHGPVPLLPAHNLSFPDAASPPATASLWPSSVIATLPVPTQALYGSAMRNLKPENTPGLTGEMRASLTGAVVAFVVHLPTADWEGRFLTRLARAEVSGRELVLWADTITAALRAFSGVGGFRFNC